ncbi:MAG TPA: hypothetical protein EYH45_06160 [Candidatus Caldiarchaeum subterraneum]|uniref:Thioredoxin domain-containing protein n=1 Tax=Caldiarchaeum subterraneum TaxID=311458 RepID=A0A832ZWI1_CALS0|nr:hypothetical protein [Candidatus Caldarchaeum subterraneum]
MRRKNLLLTLILIIAIVAGAGAFLTTNPFLTPEGKGEDEVEAKNKIDFPIQLVLEDATTEQIMVSQLYEPGKVTILEFTFIGCASCEFLHQVGYLQEFYDQYKDKVEIVSIFVHNEYPEWVLEYKDQFNVNWKYLALGDGDLIIDLRLPTLFTHIFVDDKGIERLRNPAQIEFVRQNYAKIIDLILSGQYDKLEKFGGVEVIEAG